MTAIKTVGLVGLLIVAGVVLTETISLLMLKHSVGTYKKYWEQQAALPAADNALLYVALGDSTAQGIGASKPQNGYVGLAAKALGASNNRPVHIVNLSVSGATISDAIRDQLPKFQQMSLPSDSVITIEIGANDMANFYETTFRTQIDQLFSQLPPGTVAADMPYFGSGRAKSREPSAVTASEIIAETVKRYHLRLAPLHATTKANDSWSVYGADFFHPSDKGYQNWYRAFAQALGL